MPKTAHLTRAPLRAGEFRVPWGPLGSQVVTFSFTLLHARGVGSWNFVPALYMYIMSTAVFVLFWQNWDAFAIFLTIRCKASCTLDWAIWRKLWRGQSYCMLPPFDVNLIKCQQQVFSHPCLLPSPLNFFHAFIWTCSFCLFVRWHCRLSSSFIPLHHISFSFCCFELPLLIMHANHGLS